MPEATPVRPYDEEHVTAPSGGYEPGEIVQAPSGRPGYVMGLQSIDEGQPAVIKTSGQIRVPAKTGVAFSAGDTLEWDDSNSEAVADTAGDFDLGTAAEDKASAADTVLIILGP